VDIPRPHIDIPAPHIDIPRPHIDLFFAAPSETEAGEEGGGRENVAQRVNAAMNKFGESLAERDAFHSAAIDSLANSLTERDLWNQQMAEAITHLTHAVAENATHMAQSDVTTAMGQEAMQSTATDSLMSALAEQSAWNEQITEAINQLTHAVAENTAHMAQSNAIAAIGQDAMQSTTMDTMAAALAEQNAWNQQMTEAVAQLTHAMAENSGHLAYAAGSTMGQDVLYSTVMESVASSLAEQAAWNQQITEAVAQLAHAMAESSGHVAHATATTAMGQEAMQETAMDNLAVAMEQQNAMNQQVMDVVGQVAQGLSDASGSTAETLIAAVAQLQQRMENLEGLVADLERRGKESDT
jgi:hypothetical protein